MSIDLVIGGYYGKESFRAIININAKFTSGRNITRIFRLAHVHCKKDNGEIMGNTFTSPIGDMTLLPRIFPFSFLHLI